MADHQRQRALLAGRLLRTRTRKRTGTERDRKKENTNLRVLEWMHNLETDKREAQNIQQVDVSAMMHVKTGNPLFGWTATDRPLEVPPDNLSPAPSTETSINLFVRGVGVGLTHTKNLMIKKLREVRETSGLELDQGWKRR